MPIILIEKDPFIEDLGHDGQTSSDKLVHKNVRRPLFGIQHRTETFASIEVKAVDKDGSIKSLGIKNSSAPGGVGAMNSNFIVQSSTISHQEKFQIMETFGDEYLFFFGERPIVISVQGTLINTPDFNWRSEWLYNYNKYLRGTKCVESKARVYFSLDGFIFIGYILNTSGALNDQHPRMTPFNFSMLVTSYVDRNYTSVNSWEETRQLEGGTKVEYVSSQVIDAGYRVDKDTGDLVPRQHTLYSYTELGNIVPGTEIDAPESINSPRTAHWVSQSKTGLKAFFKEDEAVREIAIRDYMNKNNTDRFSAIEAYSQGLTHFSTADSLSDEIRKALGKGTQGAAVRV